MTHAAPDDRAVVILSDLHLGPGRDPQTGRWSRLEDFFYDRELAAFLDHLRARGRAEGPVRLILNGDVFDFLLVTEVPDPTEAHGLGLTLHRAERKFGLRATEAGSVWKLARIVEGHPRVFDALGALVAEGAELVVLPGNHDPEVFFPAVQRALTDAIVGRAVGAERGRAELEGRIRFTPWFWYEPGRLFVEHGHQYDDSSVLSNLLFPLEPGRPKGAPAQVDLPVSSLFVRYLHNTLKRRNPYTRNFISFDDYLRFLGSQDLLATLPQAVRNGRFLLRAVGEEPLWVTERVRAAHRRHRELRAEVGLASGLDVRRLEALWQVPSGRTKGRLVRKTVMPAIRQVGVASAVLAATVYVWSLLFSVIQTVGWLSDDPFGKAGWLSLLAVVTFVAVAVVLRSVGRLLRTRSDATFSALDRHAQEVARIAAVPHVSMGHTHLADRRRLHGGGIFVNTGTWTALQGPWDQIQPRSMQFTFARLDDGGFHLRRWDHAAREEVTVDLFEDPPEALLRRLLPPASPTGRQRAGRAETAADQGGDEQDQ